MEHFRLIIIGAGASGIAAASKLLENGFTDFRILEAENRIGGRVFTTALENIPVELGAEWIHGEKGNIVYELAAKYDLADNGPSKVNFLKTNFYDFSGHQINKDISAALINAYYEIMHKNEKEVNNVLNDSIGAYFETEFEKSVDELRKKVKIDDSLYKKFLKAFEIWENSIDASHSWYETSLRGNLEYWECEGNIITAWKNNCYNTIFSLLTKNNQLPVDSKISFNKEIVKVQWNKDCIPDVPNVEIKCQDGTVYHCDSLLVTCSLGVLKEKASSMFIPQLPTKKINCIQNLGFGTVDKIFVKFKDCWWEDDFHGCSFLWSDEERHQDSSKWLNGIFGFHPINTTCPVLRGWITAEAAQRMELLPSDEVIKGLNYLFGKFLGSVFEVPSIEKCLTSKWYSNPHFRGSYSCRLLQSERTDAWASDLAEAVCNAQGKPILFFGGEASHDHYYSTVHGAIEAGIREAEKLLQNFQSEVQAPQYYQVAIVGAGISGLAAAKTLLKNGVSSIIVLEAQSEPGGRIRSLQVDDYFLELGAQWIHGSKNEVFTISRGKDLLTEDLSSEGEGLYLRQNGDKIDDDIVSQVDYVIKDILGNCDNYVTRNVTAPFSIGEELLLKFSQYLESCTEDSNETKKIKRELFNWHVKFHLIDNSCSDLFNLSAKAWGLFKFCGGDDYINFKNGYSSLIDTVVSSLPENAIRFDSVVERIYWAKDIRIEENDQKMYNAKIVTKDGFTVYSQHVIVTTSLGYLKSNYKSMFWPSLPNYLSEAIESLGFGVMDKIFLIYKEPWWDAQVKGFQLVWPDEMTNESEHDWGRYVTGFDVIIKNKPVLLGWVGGEGAKMVEHLSEEDVGRRATEILRKFTKNEKIPLPDKVIRTTWWRNEFVRGAYSHIPVVCDQDNISCSNLAQPVCSTVHNKTTTYEKPTILFAGEAIHQTHYSTVHGAYESGQDQARIILGYLQNRGDSS